MREKNDTEELITVIDDSHIPGNREIDPERAKEIKEYFNEIFDTKEDKERN